MGQSVLWANSWVVASWKKWLMPCVAGMLSRGIPAGLWHESAKASWSSDKPNVKSCFWDGTTLCSSIVWVLMGWETTAEHLGPSGQVEHETAVCLAECGQLQSGLCCKECSQKGQESNSSPVLDTCETTPGVLHPGLGFQCMRAQTQWSELSRGIQDGQGVWSTGCMRRYWDSWVCPGWRKESLCGTLLVSTIAWLNDTSRYQTLMYTTVVWKALDISQNTGKSSNGRMNKKKITTRGLKGGTSILGCGTSILGDIQNLLCTALRNLWQTDLLWGGVWTKALGTYLPISTSVSMILYLHMLSLD